MPDARDLEALIRTLDEPQIRAARKLLGFSFLVNEKFIVVLGHFLECVSLFVLGRLLMWWISALQISSGQSALIHVASKWYEIGAFVMFCIFAFLKNAILNLVEMRGREPSKHASSRYVDLEDPPMGAALGFNPECL